MTTTATCTTSQVSPPRRRTTALIVGVASAAVVAAGVGILANGRSDDPLRDLFPDTGTGFSADPRPLSHARLTVALTLPDTDRGANSPADVITFHGIRTHLAANTAGSSVTYWICGGRAPVSFGDGDPARQCPHLVPVVDGTRFAYPSTDRYLIAAITPSRPGRTRLVGADLSYSLGGTEVTDQVGVDASLRATPSR